MISDAAQRFHDLLRSLPRSEQHSIVEARAAMDVVVHAATEPDGVRAEPADADGVPAEWAVPADPTPGAALLYLHGGGYTMGSIVSHRRLVGHLAKASGLRALSIDYRLAPEHPFPSGLDDAVRAFGWLVAQGHDAGRLVVAGDSAGGGLALATALALRERGEALPAGLVLLSPWTDLAGTGASLVTNRATDILLRLDSGDDPDVSGYTGGRDVRDPLISPLYADYHGFPPFVVHVGGDELLLDDSTRLAERASAAGCSVTIEVWPGMQHVFQIAAGNVPESDSSVAKLGAWARERVTT